MTSARTPSAGLAVALLTLTAGLATVATQTPGPQPPAVYLVATAHLDSQWNWTVQDTIRDFVPKTARVNFAYFEKYPDYVFTWEGAIHYMWLKEYYPAEWAKLQQYVAAGRWRLAGSWINAVDVNMPSPESLFRQALYGQRFFRTEFKKEPKDIYLPDCFGFGFALPAIAAHSGLISFSTQKLTWGRPIPFPIGRWKGVDGSEIVAELNPGSYGTSINEPISLTATNGRGSVPYWSHDPTPIPNGRPLEFRYFGTGDTGGGPSETSVQNLEASLKDPNQALQIKNVTPDQLAKDLTPEQKAALPQYEGELILKTHGTGCYTSQAAMKTFNRQNELLADDAERAAVAAQFVAGQRYPTERLREAWTRVLWHQFHDDLTGTCIPQAYQFSWNDELASLNQFAGVLSSSASAVASQLDTQGAGVPLVVYNPLSTPRRGAVEATLRLAAGTAAVRVTDAASGAAVPAQVVAADAAGTHIVFVASAPSVGFQVYHVAPGARAAALPTSLKVTPSSLENNRIAVKIDANGDIASIYDKDAKRELLKAPIMLELRDDPSSSWPAWEVLYETVQSPAREYVSGPSVKVIERGPARAGVEITRHAAGSTFVQRIRLSEGGDRVEVENLVDWRSPNSLLKASFPLTAGNGRTTYDLGVGTIDRTNNEPDKYEVPAQKWADVTDAGRSFGVAILNDSKYGWDKPADDLLRLTLIHTPRPRASYTYQSSNDLGRHRFVYAIAAHAGDWRQGRVPARAAELNQPLVAFEADAHAGPLGRSFSVLTLDDTTGQVAAVALKKAEDSDEVVVRLQERYGMPARTTLRFAGNITAAREITATEEPIGPIELTAGRGGGRRGQPPQAPPTSFPTVSLDLKPYQPRAIAVKLQPPAGSDTAARVSAPVTLPFNLDGVSTDADRADGDFDGAKHTVAGELLPSELDLDGVPFTFGSSADGAKNVLVPRGERLALPAGDFNRLYVIAAAIGEDATASFGIGPSVRTIAVPEWEGPVGQWWSRLKASSALREPFVPASAANVPTTGRGGNPSQAEIQGGLVVQWDSTTGDVKGIDQIRPAFVKRDEIAWIGTHRHSPAGNQIYVPSYLFVGAVDLPAGTHEIRLPANDKLRILAMTAVREGGRATPASILYAREIPEPAPPGRAADRAGRRGKGQ
ncbi:MAG TPA: glycoside hydrolase family 38 C-terminal domain-containing protein [Vicinamibacterales bacterium]|nr:glycoside hydrolase family 38 C-terminal domain-containing protein [Vicinamibacterales bacterium]